MSVMTQNETGTMTTIAKLWTLAGLPESCRKILTVSHVLVNAEKYRHHRDSSAKSLNEPTSLFALLGNEESEPVTVETEDVSAIWATTDYDSEGEGHSFEDSIGDLTKIRFRVEKTVAEQKRRVKEKAEVFTPAWLVKNQLDIADKHWGTSVFGSSVVRSEIVPWKDYSPEQEQFETVQFSRGTDDDGVPDWVTYVVARRLEMCCGEGPYLFNSYDATNGTIIPVRNDDNEFQRIGILDRKLRVVAENVDSVEDWLIAAQAALRATYGYEWQGDNLMLARLNMVNTYLDYFVDFSFHTTGEKPTKRMMLEQLEVACEIASWQLWQMDGLRMVIPKSCSTSCVACKRKTDNGHDGILPAIRWGDEVITFEDLVIQGR